MGVGDAALWQVRQDVQESLKRRRLPDMTGRCGEQIARESETQASAGHGTQRSLPPHVDENALMGISSVTESTPTPSTECVKIPTELALLQQTYHASGVPVVLQQVYHSKTIHRRKESAIVLSGVSGVVALCITSWSMLTCCTAT